VASPFDLPAAIHGADEKATIHDDDELPGADSEDAWSLIKWTWRTVKAWLFSVLAENNSALDQDFTDNATGWTLGTGWSWSDGVGLVKTPGVESRAYLPGALDSRFYSVSVYVTVSAGTLIVSLGDGDVYLITASGTYVFQREWLSGDNIAQLYALDDFDGSVQGIEILTLQNVYDTPLTGSYVRQFNEWVEASAANITVDESGFAGNLAGEDVINMQALADWVDGTELQGWLTCAETWTRTGNHTFTVSGDMTAKYRKGAKVRYRDGGSDEYGVIGNSTHSSGTTTVTLITTTDYAMAAATITDRYISYTAAPAGFPASFNYAPSYSASGSMTYTSVSTTFAIWIPVGTAYIASLQATGTTGGTASNIIRATLPLVPSGGVLDMPGAGRVRDAPSGISPVGICSLSSSGSDLIFGKSDISNFGLGSGRLVTGTVTVPL
jgi:hypothetical protein